MKLFDAGKTTRCSAESDKARVKDPTGLAWEAYHNGFDADAFNAKTQEEADNCCAPAVTKASRR